MKFGPLWLQLGLLLLVQLHDACGSSRVRCYKDKKLGSRYPDNMYYCDDPDKPVCCEEEQQFTCCEENNTKNWREQLQLWGALGLVVVIIAVVIICWRKDTYMCEGATLMERCTTCCRTCCRRRRKGDDGSIKIRISRKYKKAPDTPSSQCTTSRHSTPFSTQSLDPDFASQDLTMCDDVDSGRGSVTSSTSVHARKRNDDVFTHNKHSNNEEFGDFMILGRQHRDPECSTSKHCKSGHEQMVEDFAMTEHAPTQQEPHQSKQRKKRKKKMEKQCENEAESENENKKINKKNKKIKKRKDPTEDEDIV